MHGAADERQQCYLTGLFDCQRQFALMFGAGSCDSSGHDFTPFSDKLSQGLRVFVAELKTIVYTESADFFSLIKSVFTATSLILTLISIHNISPSILNQSWTSLVSSAAFVSSEAAASFASVLAASAFARSSTAASAAFAAS
jgi:hypothetical protein